MVKRGLFCVYMLECEKGGACLPLFYDKRSTDLTAGTGEYFESTFSRQNKKCLPFYCYEVKRIHLEMCLSKLYSLTVKI